MEVVDLACPAPAPAPAPARPVPQPHAGPLELAAFLLFAFGVGSAFTLPRHESPAPAPAATAAVRSAPQPAAQPAAQPKPVVSHMLIAAEPVEAPAQRPLSAGGEDLVAYEAPQEEPVLQAAAPAPQARAEPQPAAKPAPRPHLTRVPWLTHVARSSRPLRQLASPPFLGVRVSGWVQAASCDPCRRFR